MPESGNSVGRKIQESAAAMNTSPTVFSGPLIGPRFFRLALDGGPPAGQAR